MTICFQGTRAAALATLKPLAGEAAAGVTASPASEATSDAATDATSAIFDLGGHSGSARAGAASGHASSASIADAAVACGAIIEGLLSQMREAAVSASDPGISSDARSALNAGFRSGLTQIQAAIGAAGIDGVNLIDGSASGQARHGLSSYDFSLGGSVIGVPTHASLCDPATAGCLGDQLRTALSKVSHALSRISGQADTLQCLGACGQSGSGSCEVTLDADGARLAALSVRQQLSSRGGAVANQAPAAILALFR